MRDIKFRAWEKSAHELGGMMWNPDDTFNDYVVSFDGRMLEKYSASFGGESYDDYRDVSDKFEVMQYTGLKDKNGEEIYEGDIVRAHEHSGQPVEWQPGGFKLLIPNIEVNYQLPLSNFVDYIKTWCEVIGNIYENGDLLK